MAETKQISAQQRAMLFGANTRQHFQMLGSKEVNSGSSSMIFNIPKVRLLQSIRILVDCNIVNTSGNAIYLGKLDAYKIIRRLSVDFNNGFSPIVISGHNLAMLNMLRLNPEVIEADTAGNTMLIADNKLAVGDNNRFIFMLEIPLTLNERDPVGLVLAQSQETNITLQVDIANDGVFGASTAIQYVKVTPETTTFSIPSIPEAFPDLSVLRVVSENNEVFQAGGQNVIKLQTGMIYRKILLYFTDADGNPLMPDDITSNIELVLNSADVPYSINPMMLRMMNISQFGYKLPEGLYIFDFSYQGIPSLGGSRDYLDTEKVTEFTLRFTSDETGKVAIVSEKLSRLVG